MSRHMRSAGRPLPAQHFARTARYSDDTKTTRWFFDAWVLYTCLALVCVGLLMVTSASMAVSDKQFHFAFHFLARQGSYLLAGIVLAWLVTRVPLSFWSERGVILLFGTLLLLMLVLIPGLGHVINGSRRWLGFSVLSFQVSELAKLGIILYMAGYIERHFHTLQHDLYAMVKPLGVLTIIACLLLLEPDFGATVVVTSVVLGLLFLSGVRIGPFLCLFLFAAAMFGVLAVISPYRLERLTSFLNPWTTQFGSGYQLTQSLMAFGRGGLWGVGLGNSIQKQFYLPEAHTDFLFAVLAEELGLIGMFAVIGLFMLLVGRCMVLARRAVMNESYFSGFLAYGLGMWIGLQMLVNIGVTAGVLPTKGLTLPFVSYGGSSLLINCVVVGLLLRIAYENKVNGQRG